MKYNIDEIDNMSLAQVENRLSEAKEEIEAATTMEQLDEITDYYDGLKQRREELKELEHRMELTRALNGGFDYNPASVGNVVARENANKNNGKGSGMNDNYNFNENDTELRGFQKYVTGQHKSMTFVEQRALSVSGAAAVMPINVMKKLITSELYSDLLYRSTVINQGGAAKIYIPIASNTSADWKIENSDVDGGSSTYEASPTLTKIELAGYELYRWMRLSAASHALATGNFVDLMLSLLSSEVIETLEKSFISGSGSSQPKGLDNLTWVTDTNQILTADDETPIAASDIAEGLSLLPQKYARGAVVLVNADTLFNTISLFKGTSEYAFSMSDGANKFMGKDVIINEHVSDDTVYIVNPKELYVRFASPIAVESNAASGFTSASIDLRALTVVDAQWNPAACIRIGLGAAA